MDLSWVMWAFSMIASMKDKLLKYWVSPDELAKVDFNNPEEVNKFAQKVVPGILKNNPQLANWVKQMASMLWTDKQKEVAEIIDMN